ncbi:MAG: N-acetyl-gamma-glutamyl-phosphate reductase [Thermodesulfobacteriota bacterium]|nr:N-acetyl-gamma-glutamyl-phosphate reductase [Thermodesulfobacteriota bacterium]
MIKAGIYGASGYTGQELLRLLIYHPEVEVVALTSRKYKGTDVSDVYPVFRGLTDIKYIDASPERVAGLCDVVFLALPHGEAMAVVPVFLEEGKKVVDLSADFRLRDVATYEKWYIKHSSSHLIERAVYGLPELYRDDIKKADLVANPGCYPTGVILGLAPLLKGDYIDISSIIVDSKSGASGAGRELQVGSLFCEVNEGFKAYKIGMHRHAPEMEQELSVLSKEEVKILFTPHLLPTNRGILSTIYAHVKGTYGASQMTGVYEDFYADEKFVRVCKAGSMPNISSVRGSNYCDIGITVDERTERIVIVSAIDNLMKGAAGQAVQNMNLMYGLPEDAGLNLVSLFP